MLVGALNVGDTGVPPTSVNAAPFQSFAAPSGSGTSGNFTMTGGGGVFANNSAGASPNAPFNQTLLTCYADDLRAY